jgi:hypothetical protein
VPRGLIVQAAFVLLARASPCAEIAESNLVASERTGRSTRRSTGCFLFKFHVDFATPSNSTFTGPTSIAVASFAAACSGGGTCIPQPNTSTTLDSLADRLMYWLAYRNRGGTESLVVNHSVTVSGKKHSTFTRIRWYELRVARSPDRTGTPSVFQQGTYAPDSSSRWMDSIAMDKVGDIALGYSVSSASVLPSIRYTGRVPGDRLGTLEAENSILAGGGS